MSETRDIYPRAAKLRDLVQNTEDALLAVHQAQVERDEAVEAFHRACERYAKAAAELLLAVPDQAEAPNG